MEPCMESGRGIELQRFSNFVLSHFGWAGLTVEECSSRCASHILCKAWSYSPTGARQSPIQGEVEGEASCQLMTKFKTIPAASLSTISGKVECQCMDRGDADEDGVANCADACPGAMEAFADVDGDGKLTASDCGAQVVPMAGNPVRSSPSYATSEEEPVVMYDPSLKPDYWCYEEGVTYNGNLFLPDERVSAGIATPRLCQVKCQAYAECKTWAFDYERGCRMFEDAVAEEYNKQPDVYSTLGPQYCDDTPGIVGGCIVEACSYQDDESNNIMSYERTATPWRCQFSCAMNDDCNAFHFEYDTALCVLKRKENADKRVMGGSRRSLCGPKSCNLWPKSLVNAIPVSPPLEDFVKGMLSRMTLVQKIGQMVLTPDAFYSPESQLGPYQVNVLWGPGYKLNEPITSLQSQWESIYHHSESESEGQRISIPSLVAVDAVHGLGMAKGATMFPHNIGLGCANDTDLMETIGKITAIEMTAAGADWTLAPMTAVTMDVRWGRTYESYSMDGHTVRTMAEALLIGLQGRPTDDDFVKGTHVAGMCKHFLADGAPLGGFTDGDADIDESDLVAIHGEPFVGCLKAGMMTTMPSFNDVNGWEMHQNKFYLQTVLKDQMKFDGVVLSDWNAHQQIMGCPWSADDCPEAINAGVDMFLVAVGGGSHWDSFVEKTRVRVEETGDVSLARIDDAAGRILRMKARMGLIGPNPAELKGSPLNRPGADSLEAVLGQPAHLAVAQEAVRKSVVMLKNNEREGKRALPLSDTSTILVTGRYKEKYLQHGAWSMDWQGQKDDSLYGYASSLRDALRAHMQKANKGGRVVYNPTGSKASQYKFDAIIFVTAEHPYAEVEGDLVEDSLMHRKQNGRRNNFGKTFAYAEEFAILQNLRKNAPTTPIITIVYSGRPLYMNAEINLSDAFLAAWLPGTMAGEGLTDLLFRREVSDRAPFEDRSEGDKTAADFHGRLSFHWPSHPCATMASLGDGQFRDFNFGYGLTYQGEQVDVPELDDVYIEKCEPTYCWDWECTTGQFVGIANMPNDRPQTTD